MLEHLLVLSWHGIDAIFISKKLHLWHPRRTLEDALTSVKLQSLHFLNYPEFHQNPGGIDVADPHPTAIPKTDPAYTANSGSLICSVQTSNCPKNRTIGVIPFSLSEAPKVHWPYVIHRNPRKSARHGYAAGGFRSDSLLRARPQDLRGHLC